MSEPKENPPYEEIEMVAFPQEANEEQPENPQQQHSVEQPEEAEEEEEEEKDKKTVLEETKPLEPAKGDGESLEPYLVRLEHDLETQRGYLLGMIDYHRLHGVFPFQMKDATVDFVDNWLQVRVRLDDFMKTQRWICENFLRSSAAIARNLDYLNDLERQVFFLKEKIFCDRSFQRSELAISGGTLP